MTIVTRVDLRQNVFLCQGYPSEDRSISLWELPSGRELARWPAHAVAVNALAFSPDGATLASDADDATTKLWNLPFLRRELRALGLDW